MIFEVFRRERKGQAFEHAGSVDAPDLTFAEAYAVWAAESVGAAHGAAGERLSRGKGSMMTNIDIPQPRPAKP